MPRKKKGEPTDAERIAARAKEVAAQAPVLTPEQAAELRPLLLAENVTTTRGKGRGRYTDDE